MMEFYREIVRRENPSLALAVVCVAIFVIHLAIVGQASGDMDDQFIEGLFQIVGTFNGRVHHTYQIGAQIPVASAIICARLCFQVSECDSFFLIAQSASLYPFLCQRHSVVFTSISESDHSPDTTYWTLTDDGCPTGNNFTLHRALDLCYRLKFVEEKENAQDTCNQLGSHLLELPTEAHWQHITNFITVNFKPVPEPILIGGRYFPQNQTGCWSDGSDLTPNKWAPGEPAINSGETKRCLAITGNHFFLMSLPCNGQGYTAFICEKDTGEK